MSHLPGSLPGSPRRALRVSIYLIAIECLMLAYPSNNWLVTGALFAWAASRWWTIRNGWCPKTPLLWNAIALSVVFAIKFSLFPATFPTDAPFVNTELAHEIGCWLVSFQILILHDPSSLKRIPASIAAFGCLVVLCAGDIQLHSISRNFFLVLMMMFVGGLAWFSHSSREWVDRDPRRRLRRSLLFITLFLASVPTVLAARAWHQHERDLETLLLKIMQIVDGSDSHPLPRSRPNLTQISNGKIHEPEKLVLRVLQESAEPLYLKGSTYNQYEPRSTFWSRNPPTARPLSPCVVPENLTLRPNQNLFRISTSNLKDWKTATIEYLAPNEAVPLAPLHTQMIQVGVSELRIDVLSNFFFADESPPGPYTVYYTNNLEREPPPDLNDLTRIMPPRADLRFQNIADSIFANMTSDSQKIQAVQDYFHDHFRYALGFTPSRFQDPILDFLLTKAAAHCEYFATATVLLLRAGGVPARYVTGYVTSERHPDGVWIARRKDAHAWVEAYDSTLQRWVTVESTPSAGVPDEREAGWKDAWWESWRAWFALILDLIRQNQTWPAISMALQTTSVRILLGGILVSVWWAFSRRFRADRTHTPDQRNGHSFAFQPWLLSLETELRKRGFERQPHETLLQFRDRILNSPQRDELRATAEWYAEYSSIRYHEAEQTDSRIAQLELSWKNLNPKSPSPS